MTLDQDFWLASSLLGFEATVPSGNDIKRCRTSQRHTKSCLHPFWRLTVEGPGGCAGISHVRNLRGHGDRDPLFVKRALRNDESPHPYL